MTLVHINLSNKNDCDHTVINGHTRRSSKCLPFLTINSNDIKLYIKHMSI